MNARPVRVLTLYFVAWKLLLLLVVFCAPGPGYDTSTTLLGLEHVPTNTSNEKGNIAGIPEPRAIFPLLLQKLVRWDAIYFVKIAERGYLFEQEWAFGYGRVLGIVSSLGRASGLIGIGWAGVALSHICHYLSVLTLYALSKNLFERGKTRAVRRDNGGTHKSAAQGDTSGTYSSSIAFLSAVLHIICPAGVFLSAPYGEAPFSLLNFAGFYLYTSAPFDAGSCGSLRSDLKLLAAGAVFALATMVRSNGALSGILFAYDAIVIVLGVVRDGITFPLVRRLACVLLGGSLIVVGIAAPQYVAYKTYCVSADVPRSWCQNIPPSVYTWVQSHYWNVGFLRYWTVSNIPLFLLATPMLLVMIWSSASALLGGPASLVRTKNTGDEHLQACLTRLALPQGLLALAAFVGYHVQIINRLSSGYPLWYWYIASHILSESKLPRSPSTPLGQSIIVRGMAMYGLIQAALFGSFLPPA